MKKIVIKSQQCKQLITPKMKVKQQLIKNQYKGRNKKNAD